MTTHHCKRKLFSILFTFLIGVFLLFTCNGCQTTNKSDSYHNTAEISNAQFQYTQSADRTQVVWSANLTNDTIYDITEFEITFRVFEGENYHTQTYTYLGVEHGESKTNTFTFYADGRINYIEYVSWTAHYDSFWNTYKIPIFITSGIAIAAAIAYVILMVLNDWDFEDLLNLFLFLPLLFILSGFGFISSWVLALIIAGGILSALTITCIAQAIYSFLN